LSLLNSTDLIVWDSTSTSSTSSKGQKKRTSRQRTSNLPDPLPPPVVDVPPLVSSPSAPHSASGGSSATSSSFSLKRTSSPLSNPMRKRRASYSSSSSASPTHENNDIPDSTIPTPHITSSLNASDSSRRPSSTNPLDEETEEADQEDPKDGQGDGDDGALECVKILAGLSEQHVVELDEGSARTTTPATTAGQPLTRTQARALVQLLAQSRNPDAKSQSQQSEPTQPQPSQSQPSQSEPSQSEPSQPQPPSSSSQSHRRSRRGRYSALYDDLYHDSETTTTHTESKPTTRLPHSHDEEEEDLTDYPTLPFLPNRSLRVVRIGSSHQVEDIPPPLSSPSEKEGSGGHAPSSSSSSCTLVWNPSLCPSHFNLHSYLQRASSLVSRYCLTFLLAATAFTPTTSSSSTSSSSSSSQPPLSQRTATDSIIEFIQSSKEELILSSEATFPSNLRLLSAAAARQLQVDGSYIPLSSSYEDIFLEALIKR
jgi:hypothetical protein